MNQETKQLAIAQEKLKAIDTLSNCLAKVSIYEKIVEEISYLIHKIIEADFLDITLSREVMSWSIKINQDIFVEKKQ